MRGEKASISALGSGVLRRFRASNVSALRRGVLRFPSFRERMTPISPEAGHEIEQMTNRVMCSTDGCFAPLGVDAKDGSAGG